MLSRLASVLAAQPHPVRFLLSRVLWRTGLCRLLTIKRPRYALRFYPSVMSADLWVNRGEARSDELFFERYLRPGDTVVDVGANVGDLAVLAGVLTGPSGSVLAIEAHPRTFGFLEGNIALNGLRNVRALNRAAGNARGSIEFADSRTDDQNRVLTAGAGVSVEMAPLDELAPVAGRLALLKIDVEGYELPVLQGASKALRAADCVFIEAYEQAYRHYGYSTADVLRALDDSGFLVYRIGDDGLPVKLPGGFVAHECQNLVAVQDARTLERITEG